MTADADYDQSNWAQLILKEPVGTDAEDIQGRLLLGQTVIGTLTNRDNPTIELRVNPIPTVEASYVPNTFLPANFVEQTDYFMVEPKAQEFVNIQWAICREQVNDSTFVMVVPKCDGDVIVKRTGKGKIFYGCSNYPNCDFVSWYEPVEERCPNCGDILFKRKGKKGGLFCQHEGCGYKK
jgi:hypothetical protein